MQMVMLHSPEKLLGFAGPRINFCLDFPDCKCDYIKDVYCSNVCFVGRGMWTGDFCGD